MAQPTGYTPATDFSDDELNNVGGRSTVRTANLDAEFAAIETTLDQTLVNISLNQRDDGEIRDGRVKLHTLATSVLALFAATAGTPRGAWVTATAYALRDVVTQSTNTYICCVAHTSGTFATDLAAVKWLLVALGSAPSATGIPFTPTATIAATNVQAAIDESDTENRALSAAALAAATASGTAATAYDTAMRADLLDKLTVGKGPALVGFGAELAYAIRSMGHEAATHPSIDAFIGVDPTGAVDCASAFNTAIAAASALGIKTLRFPGTYKVLSAVTLANNMAYIITGTINLNVAEVGLQLPAACSKINIDGQGTGIIQGTCSRAISSVLASTATDIRIRGMTVTGATLVGAGYTNGIFLDGVTRCWIENNRLYGNGIGASTATGNGDITLYAATNSNVYVQRNYCTSTTVGVNIAVYNCTEAHIDFNTASGAVCGTSQNNGYGILLYSSVSDVCRRSTVNGNVVQNTGGTGIYLQDVLQVVCANNMLDDVAKTQTDVGLPVGGIALNTCTDAAITGNVVRKSGKAGIVSSTGTRVSITGGSCTDCSNAGVYLRGPGDGTIVSGVVLENNAINLYADATAKSHLLLDVISRTSKTATRGIDLGNVSNSVIRGVSSNNARGGLVILAGANNVVQGMVCLDNGTDTANTYDGIASAATNTKLIGCRSGNTGATGQRYGINSTGNYCTIQDNDLTRNQSDGYSISGTSLQKDGNRQSLSATPGVIQGSGVLVAGTVTISTDEIRNNDQVVITCLTAGGTQGIVRVSAIVNATSFTLTSSNAADTSTYQYQIVH